MAGVYKFPFSIAYADTDAGGIVYHGRYIEMAERARMQILRGISFPENDVGFVIRQLSIKYLKPLKLADDVVIETSAKDIGAAFIEFEQKFVKNDEIYAIIYIKVAYVGADLRPRRIPDSVAQIFMQ